MNNELTIKAVFRNLTPPLVWRLLRRAIIRDQSRAEDQPGAERPSEYYDAGYLEIKQYHQHYADSPYFFLWCALVERIRPATIGCLFDVGCGPGQLAAFLHDRGLKRYVGLDFSSQCISMAHNACPSFEFVCADAHTSDLFRTLDYDVVVSTEFLEHVQEDLAIIDRIRPGTRVYASVPNFPHRAHVRHFKSCAEVYRRYSSRFMDFRVDEFPFGSGGMSLFLFEGCRGSLRN